MNYKRKKGDAGEELAVNELKKRRHKIIERNYLVSGVGEIDIISRTGEYIVFSEVKTRKPDMLYSPREAVDAYKQQKIKRTAQMYLMRQVCDLQPRFDVIEVIGEGEDALINIIENAF